MTEIEFWLQFRQALLMLVDLIERVKTGTKPRTSELRKDQKQQQPERSAR